MENRDIIMGRCLYVSRSEPGENQYFNTVNVRHGGVYFFNNLLRESRISDIAVFKPARNFKNQNEFVRQIIQTL